MKHTIQIFTNIGKGLGEFSSQKMAAELRNAGDNDVVIDINSEGGDVMEGFTIAELIRQYPGTVTTRVLGGALSIASVIALEGDVREIADNAVIMIHQPMMNALGTAEEFRANAEVIEKIEKRLIGFYSRYFTDMTSDEIQDMMRRETWFDADEAIEFGLMMRKIGAAKIAAEFDDSKYIRVPKRFALHREISAPTIKRPSKKEGQMSSSNGEQTRNEIKDIFARYRKACPGASAEFLLNALENEMDPEEAVAKYNEELQQINAELRSANEELMAQNEELKGMLEAVEKEPESDEEEMVDEEMERAMASYRERINAGRSRRATPIRNVSRSTTGDLSNDPRTAFNQLVSEKIRNGMRRSKAVAAVVREYPDVHQAMIEAVNG